MNKTLFKLHSWMALAAFVPLLLSITGIYIWYQRREKRRNARDKRRAKAAALAGAAARRFLH